MLDFHLDKDFMCDMVIINNKTYIPFLLSPSNTAKGTVHGYPWEFWTVVVDQISLSPIISSVVFIQNITTGKFHWGSTFDLRSHLQAGCSGRHLISRARSPSRLLSMAFTPALRIQFRPLRHHWWAVMVFLSDNLSFLSVLLRTKPDWVAQH